MRLSEAILLGDSLKKPDGMWYKALHGCGCAIAGARLAAGHSDREPFVPLNSPQFVAEWPWVTQEQLYAISRKYFRVERGEMTIEQLADYVHSIEPLDSPESVTPQTVSQSEKVTA